MIFYVGIGSNSGNRNSNLCRALNCMKKEGFCLRRVSSLFKTQPVDFVDQRDFYNMVAEIESELSPDELLDLIKKIEVQVGRNPSFPKGPREIDIDILLAGDLVISHPKLQIPHPRLEWRNFVLVPLNEIAPLAIHPVLKKTIATLMRESQDNSRVELVNSEEKHAE
jgi:dihydroneopterin aldolase/2-amino-4-hydroxy-6-hydroxymethyldihydropteridine diphosphokinase